MTLLISLISAYYIIAIYNIYIRTKNKEKISLYVFNRENTLSLRGMLAISLTFCHLASVTFIHVFSEFSEWGVYIVSVFFFITGYGLIQSYKRKKEYYLKGFIMRRYSKIIPPYVVCVILYILSHYLLSKDYSLVRELSSSGIDISGALLPTSWFVVVLIFFYPSFYWVMRIVKSAKRGIVFLIVWSILYYMLLNKLNFGEWWTVSIFAINIGMIYALYEDKIMKKFSIRFIVYETMGLLLLLFIYVLIPLIYQCVYDSYIGGIYKVWGISILPLFVVFPMYAAKFFDDKLMLFLGTISYEIYLCQGVFRDILYGVFVNQYIYIFVALILSVLTAYVVNKFCSIVVK